MPESLTDQFISDLYTSLIHLSGSELGTNLNKIFDGAGNSTGLALSGDRVVINNYIYPDGGLDPIEWLDAFFPIGCLQLTFDNNNPETRIAGTTWEHVAEGRFIVGVGECFVDSNSEGVSFAPGDPTEEGSTDADTTLPRDGNDAGEFRVTLETADMPSHQHQTNIEGVNVQIDSPTGSGAVFEAQTPPVSRNVDSSDRFKWEERARNRLKPLVGWNKPDSRLHFYPYGFDPDLDDNFLSAQYEAFLTALDLNFLRGSAANYPEAERNAYLAGTRIQTVMIEWKEMVGMWNGETRFIPVEVNPGRGPGIGRSRWLREPVKWVLDQQIDGDPVIRLGMYVEQADDAAFLVSNQQLPTVQPGPDQPILQHTDNVQFRTSTRVGLGTGHNLLAMVQHMEGV